MLVKAENPVIVADRMARTPAGIERLVELAETLQCAVCRQGRPHELPDAAQLNQSERSRALIAQADVILGLEMNDFWQCDPRLQRQHRALVELHHQGTAPS